MNELFARSTLAEHGYEIEIQRGKHGANYLYAVRGEHRHKLMQLSVMHSFSRKAFPLFLQRLGLIEQKEPADVS